MSQPARICPACDELLRSWKIGSTTVDGCDACGGVWFDAGEVRALANLPGDPFEATEQEFIRGLVGNAGGGRRRCPADRQPLQPRRFRLASDIEVLCCPECDGIWLEEGELHQLAQRVPKHRGPLPLPDLPTLGVTAVAGLARTCHCPRCDAPNPDLRERCLDCGADLHAPATRPTGSLLSAHPVGWSALLFELLVIGFVLMMLYLDGWRHPALVSLLPDGWYPVPAAVILSLWVGHALTRTWRVDATSEGLLFHRVWRRKFIPWDAIRSSVSFDLGTRAIWYPVTQFLGGIGWPHYGGYATADCLESLETRLRVLMFLYTSRGLVAIGPDLDREGELIERVLNHMDH